MTLPMDLHLPSRSLAALIVVVALSIGCYRSPQDGFNAFLARFDTLDAEGTDAPSPDGSDHGSACEPSGDPDLSGAFVLAFITTLKTEPSRDVLLVLEQCGIVSDGTAVISGRAVSVEMPDMVLGQIPEVPVDTDWDFELVVTDFLIPPGQEDLLPDGGMAEITLHAGILDPDRFCGEMDFRLVTPIELDQEGSFGAYRQDVLDPGEAGCPE